MQGKANPVDKLLEVRLLVLGVAENPKDGKSEDEFPSLRVMDLGSFRTVSLSTSLSVPVRTKFLTTMVSIFDLRSNFLRHPSCTPR